MRKLILKMSHSGAIRKVVKTMRLQVPVNWWLHKFPVVKTLPSGIQYRARRVESLGLSADMFDENNLYTITNKQVRTFADLGCNVGYFTCWLCERLKNRQLKGLMVDANPEAVEDAQWHITQNQLHDIYALQGLAGLPNKKDQIDFFLHTSNVCSTATPDDSASADSWTRIQVPCLDIEENWNKRFGSAPCDLLKMDIEGSEADFFRNETQFMRRVGTVLLEWHKFKVSLDEVVALLSANGFSLETILHEDACAGTAIFVKK
jgi:FkbM family methyltransferase